MVREHTLNVFSPLKYVELLYYPVLLYYVELLYYPVYVYLYYPVYVYNIYITSFIKSSISTLKEFVAHCFGEQCSLYIN